MNYVVESYENYKEENSLTTNNARKIEFITTTRVLDQVIGEKSKILDCAAGTGIIETGVLKHDDEKCFWTDTYYSSKEEMELIYGKYGLEIIDHFAQDGLTPLLSDKVDNWDESQFKIWCDYHYSICREPSILGSSNHVIIIGRK